MLNKMGCKHKLVVFKRKHKGTNIYKVACTECGLCSIWAETEELARGFSILGIKK